MLLWVPEWDGLVSEGIHENVEGGRGKVTRKQEHPLETAVGFWVHEDGLKEAVVLFKSSNSSNAAGTAVLLMPVMVGSAAERFSIRVSGEFE